MEPARGNFTIVPVMVGGLSPSSEAKYGKIFAKYLKVSSVQCLLAMFKLIVVGSVRCLCDQLRLLSLGRQIPLHSLRPVCWRDLSVYQGKWQGGCPWLALTLSLGLDLDLVSCNRPLIMLAWILSRGWTLPASPTTSSSTATPSVVATPSECSSTWSQRSGKCF